MSIQPQSRIHWQQGFDYGMGHGEQFYSHVYAPVGPPRLVKVSIEYRRPGGWILGDGYRFCAPDGCGEWWGSASQAMAEGEHWARTGRFIRDAAP